MRGGVSAVSENSSEIPHRLRRTGVGVPDQSLQPLPDRVREIVHEHETGGDELAHQDGQPEEHERQQQAIRSPGREIGPLRRRDARGAGEEHYVPGQVHKEGHVEVVERVLQRDVPIVPVRRGSRHEVADHYQKYPEPFRAVQIHPPGRLVPCELAGCQCR